MPRFVISSKSYDDNQVLSGSIVSGFGRTELVYQLRRPKVMLNHNKRTNTSSNVGFWWEAKTGVPRERTSQSSVESLINPHKLLRLESNPGHIDESLLLSSLRQTCSSNLYVLFFTDIRNKWRECRRSGQLKYSFALNWLFEATEQGISHLIRHVLIPE